MKLVLRAVIICCLVGLAMPASAEKHSKKSHRGKRAASTAMNAPDRVDVPLNRAQTASPAIPEESSFNADLKNKPKVVIVPAPPPPPGPDPVPARRNP